MADSNKARDINHATRLEIAREQIASVLHDADGNGLEDSNNVNMKDMVTILRTYEKQLREFTRRRNGKDSA